MRDCPERSIGYRFSQEDLLVEALTHRSVEPAARNYERLEFLGDRVLSLIIADLLLKAFPAEDVGALAKRHVALVRREALGEVALSIGLGAHIRLSRGEEDAGGRDNPAILADVCEAVIAALYLDGGETAARAFVERHWMPRLESDVEPPQDPKTALQEWAQGRGLPLPVYNVTERSGPDHAPVFTVSVGVEGHGAEQGEGTTKRVAERRAAQRLLNRVTER